MTNRPTLYRYVWIIIFVFLVACGQQPAALPTDLPTPTATSSPTPFPTLTPIPVTVTPSPLPTQPTIPFITPDPIQVEKWKEYEDALGMQLLPPNSLRGKVLCEWEILGRSDKEVYVWAFCQSPPYSKNLKASIASIPAVIYLQTDGTIQSVNIPGSGTAYASDIRKLFPADIQEKIFSHSIDTNRMEAHINWRREDPEPPLVILSATPTP